jgi:Lrp/AsnC family leucine-responsive transcriptional regulator
MWHLWVIRFCDKPDFAFCLILLILFVMMTPKLDQVDLRILAALQDDARIGYQELGDSVGLSAAAVFQRVRKLEEGGVLAGYHAEVDPAALGRSLVAFIHVVPGPGADTERLRDQWRAMTDVQECHLMTGAVGFLLKVRVGGPPDLEPMLDAARRAGCEVRVELALATVSPQLPMSSFSDGCVTFCGM